MNFLSILSLASALGLGYTHQELQCTYYLIENQYQAEMMRVESPELQWQTEELEQIEEEVIPHKEALAIAIKENDEEAFERHLAIVSLFTDQQLELQESIRVLNETLVKRFTMTMFIYNRYNSEGCYEKPDQLYMDIALEYCKEIEEDELPACSLYK